MVSCTCIPPVHLAHQRFVTVVKRHQTPHLPLRFKMLPVSGFPHRQDVPEPVQLAMLAEQVLTAEDFGKNVPDSHGAYSGSFGVSV